MFELPVQAEVHDVVVDQVGITESLDNKILELFSVTSLLSRSVKALHGALYGSPVEGPQPVVKEPHTVEAAINLVIREISNSIDELNLFEDRVRKTSCRFHLLGAAEN